ncbi:hypothetical protein MJO28_016177 [Puccinia striiformis f. sp. tritici]|uniref:Uncharacterized protein n=1 Tax=Puccinia striiformis f. sp. tritici TaxID=168172 RepID=A0ACC0DNE4_9BASI|nr:hypothetical protein MJO28_016177 [Puccinia striiformis f. sp. tritici]
MLDPPERRCALGRVANSATYRSPLGNVTGSLESMFVTPGLGIEDVRGKKRCRNNAFIAKGTGRSEPRFMCAVDRLVRVGPKF